MTEPSPSGRVYIGRHRWWYPGDHMSMRIEQYLSQAALPTKGMHEPRHLKPEEGGQP